MAIQTLAGLFGDSRLKLQYAHTARLVSDLQRPANDGEFALPGVRLKEHRPIDVLGRPLAVDADLNLGLDLSAPGAQEPFFAGEPPQACPEGAPWSRFQFSTGAHVQGADVSLAAAPGALTLSLHGKAGADFSYLHLLPTRVGDKRRTALWRAAKGSRLPANVRLGDMEVGELHRWSRSYYFDFGLKGELGRVFDIKEVVELFKDCPVELQAHVEAGLSASLGLGLYDEMDLTLARRTDDGWIRVRLERRRKKDLGLGARVAIQAQYDLGGTSLLGILNEALDGDPARRVLTALADVRQYTAGGNVPWDRIRQKLEDRTVRTLGKLFDHRLDVDRWVDGSPEVDSILRWAEDVVDTYESAGDTVRSWWGDMIGQAHLGDDSELRQALREIGSLDLDTFTADQISQIPSDLVEVLAGDALDPLVDTLKLREIVGRAQDVAREGTALLDRLKAVPESFIDRFNAFAAKTGIDKAVAVIRRFDTPDKLKSALEEKENQWIQTLAERLVGKAWGLLDARDLATLSRWAGRLDGYLLEIQQKPDQIRAALKRLRGDFDLSLGVFYQRSTASGSVIDLVFDPEDGRLERAVEAALDEREAQRLLSRLPDSEAIEGAAKPTYQILESVFTRRFTATGTFSLLFKFLGRSLSRTVVNQRLAASRVEVVGSGRHALYVGGFERSIVHDTYSFQSVAHLEAEARGPGKELNDDYDQVAWTLHLGMARTDQAVTDQVGSAFHDLLSSVGLAPSGADIRDILNRRLGQQARFTLRLILPDAAVRALLRPIDEDTWRELYVTAAQRWFRDDLTADRRLTSGLEPLQTGEVLAELVAKAKVQEFTVPQLFPGHGAPGESFQQWIFAQRFPVRVGDRIEAVPGERLFPPLASVIWHRDKGFDAMSKLRAAFPDAAAPSPGDLWSVAKRASATLDASQAGHWSNPMFNVWLLQALIDHGLNVSEDPQAPAKSLRGVRGVAQLRVRRSKNDSWSTADDGTGRDALWTLNSGQGFVPWPGQPGS